MDLLNKKWRPLFVPQPKFLISLWPGLKESKMNEIISLLGNSQNVNKTHEIINKKMAPPFCTPT